MLRTLNAQSIASRLFLSAAFWSAAILILAGLGLSALNARWTEASFDEQLGVYVKALVAEPETLPRFVRLVMKVPLLNCHW